MSKTKKITYAAIIGAAYAVLTIILAPISYGALQLRVSEALCIMPFLFPESSFGLFVGCIISNIYSGNIFDIIFGSAATLLSAYLTSKSNKLWLGCLWPVIINAIVISMVVTFAYIGVYSFKLLIINFLQIGLSEAIVMYLIGLPMAKLLKSKKGELFK